MQHQIVLLFSGPVAAGKSTFSMALVQTHAFTTIRSSAYLRRIASERGLDTQRGTLQMLGDQLDDTTDYRWLIEDVAVPLIQSALDTQRWLLDSVRKERQVSHFRARFGEAVRHVHVIAPEIVLRRRYEERQEMGGDHATDTSYDDAIAHPNERASRELGAIADLTIDSTDPLAMNQLLALIPR